MRINGQSGKGGVTYAMSPEFGFAMPMHVEIGSEATRRGDELGCKLTANEIYETFGQIYLQRSTPLEVTDTEFEYVRSNPRTLRCRRRTSQMSR